MAASNGAVAESEVQKDGPVLMMMSKRLRSLKKKYNRILQIEENKATGKAINKEQEEVLKTKIVVASLIDEYEKLRQPLAAAIKEELAEREKELMIATVRQQEEEEGISDDERNLERKDSAEEKEALSPDVRKDLDVEAVCNGTNEGELLHGSSDGEGRLPHDDTTAIADIVKLLYFAHLFDIRSHREAASLVWTKVHERSSCLSYDFVTDDSASPLLEGDLDTLALFGSLLTSRSPNLTLSHKEALQLCIQHASLWLQNSDSPIQPDAGITYSHLKERLSRILSSEYYTMTPELQTVSQQTSAIAATTEGQYVTEVLIHKVSTGSTILDTDKLSTFYSHEDEADSEGQLSPEKPVSLAPLEVSSDTSVRDCHITVNSTPTHGTESLKLSEEDDEVTITANDDTNFKAEHTQQEEVTYMTQQQQQANVFQTIGPRGYQGFRGRGMGYGASGRGRSYGGRGWGRGGRGAYYGNGRGGQYFDQGGYFQRNYYGRDGRGGRDVMV